MHITVIGPSSGRPAAPVAARVPLGRVDDNQMMGLVDESTGRPLAVQVDSRGRLCWLQEALHEGERRRYRLDIRGFLADTERVIVREDDAANATIHQNNRAIACYVGNADQRPFLTPLLSPGNHEVTARPSSGPACWCGWGDVNGVDHWTDSRKAGRQIHRRFTLSVSGPVFGRLSALIDWIDAEGRPQFTEQRVYTFYHPTGGSRIVDVVSRFMMVAGPVTFGDTADGGLLAVHLADVLSSRRGAMVRNANGEESLDDCRGSASAWCDITGQIDDQFVGLAVLDYPGNVRFPTFWNVTPEGLIAANPFGLASFVKDCKASGSRTFEKDSVVMFRYRMIIHDGSRTSEDIDMHSACFTKSLEIIVE